MSVSSLSLSACVTTGVQLFFQGKPKRELLNCPIKQGGAWFALSAYSASWLTRGAELAGDHLAYRTHAVWH